MNQNTVQYCPSSIVRRRVELLAEFFAHRAGEWHLLRSICAHLQPLMATKTNRTYLRRDTNTLRDIFGWDIEAGRCGVRLVSRPMPIVWPDDLDAQIDSVGTEKADAKHELTWSDDETEYLIEHFGGMPLNEIEQAIDRSEIEIKQKMIEIGIDPLDAHGLMTTGHVARLCGVTLKVVQRWCLRSKPGLRFKRSPDGSNFKLIDPVDLRHFLHHNSNVFNRRPKAVQHRIERYLETVCQRVRGASS